jgi:hypothetical protein
LVVFFKTFPWLWLSSKIIFVGFCAI